MSTKLIKVEVLGPSGEWIAAQRKSVGEATRDAIAKINNRKRKNNRPKKRKKV